MTPSFDTWTSIFLFASIQGLFVALILFFVKKENRYANRLLALILLLFSITLFEYVFFWTRYIILFPHLLSVSAGFALLYGPLLYFYFRYVAESKKITIRDAWHFIPFLLFLIYFMPFYFSSAEHKVALFSGTAHPSQQTAYILKFIIWTRVVLLVFYLAFIQFSLYKKINISAEIREWYRWIMIFFGCFVVSYASYFVLVNFSFFNNTWDYAISFSMSFFIFFIAWFGYLQPQVFNGFDLKELLFKPKYKSSNLTELASKSLIQSANQLMETQQVYQESELSLEQLAEMLGTTKHSLSQAINENTQLNFFEYINRFRIGEAQRLLSETSKQQYNVIDIAYMVGFNNKVSFYNTFKKITGTTPTEFRRKYQSPHQATKA